MSKTVLKIGTRSCPPCHRLKPIFETLKEEFNGKINFLEVSDDGDYDLFEKFCVKFNIRGVPVVIVMDGAENELERLTGLNNVDTYRDVIKKHIIVN